MVSNKSSILICLLISICIASCQSDSPNEYVVPTKSPALSVELHSPSSAPRTPTIELGMFNGVWTSSAAEIIKHKTTPTLHHSSGTEFFTINNRKISYSLTSDNKSDSAIYQVERVLQDKIADNIKISTLISREENSPVHVLIFQILSNDLKSAVASEYDDGKLVRQFVVQASQATP